jgi:hypothetical protein
MLPVHSMPSVLIDSHVMGCVTIFRHIPRTGRSHELRSLRLNVRPLEPRSGLSKMPLQQTPLLNQSAIFKTFPAIHSLKHILITWRSVSVLPLRSNFTIRRHSCKLGRHAVEKGIHSFVCAKIHHGVYKMSPSWPVFSGLNPFYFCTQHFCKTCVNIILSSTPRSFKCPSAFML